MGAAARPRAYRWILAFLRLLVRCFFRRVEVSGLEHVPRVGGGIVVSWHPNGLIDPGLVLTSFSRQIVFGARHGIFKWPLLGWLMRSIGTVPIYRAADLPSMSNAARATANSKSLDALAVEIARGSFSALFPEGVSHDAPHLLELKTGAARLFYRACATRREGFPEPIIVPVGLHYDDKDLFRSNAMVEFHPPVVLSPALAFDPTWDDVTLKRKARELTDEIERVLTDVVLATENWRLHRLMHRARKLVRAERASRAGANPGKSLIGERVLGFARIREGYNRRLESHPEQVVDMVNRVEEYDADLQALSLEDHELDRAPRLASPMLAVLLTLQVLTVYLILPSVLLIGYVVNAPGALLLMGLSRLAANKKKDEATIKVLLGAVLFPLSWLGAALVAAWGYHWLYKSIPNLPASPVLAGLVVALLAAIGGAVGLRYLRLSRETARAVRVRLTRLRRRRAIQRLREERATLHDALIGLADGLALPGEVAEDGRIKYPDSEPEARAAR